MARQKELPSVDKYNAPFPERLRKLMETQHKTQQDVADYLGKSRQAVGSYANGSSSPDWETIAQLARYFNVSSDWLLGITEIKDKQIASISVGVLGLTDEAVSALIQSRNDVMATAVINHLLENGSLLEKVRKYYASFVIDLIKTNPPFPADVISFAGDYRLFLADIFETLPKDRSCFEAKISANNSFVDKAEEYFLVHDKDVSLTFTAGV